MKDASPPRRPKNGGDRLVGRKLFGCMHEIGLQGIGVVHTPIPASAFGQEVFYSIVYSFKRRVLERAGGLDDQSAALFSELENRAASRRPSPRPRFS